MTKTITVKDCEQIIDRLADKEEFDFHSCAKIMGCDGCERRIVVENLPVLIGDVLAKIYDGKNLFIDLRNNLFKRLISLWATAGGLNQPLQDILAEAEKETGYIFDGQFCQSDCNNATVVITGPAAELFIFLEDLNLTNDE